MPLNPPAPLPPKSEQVKTAIQAKVQQNRNDIEIAACGGLMGILVVLVGAGPAVGLIVCLAFVLGGVIEKILLKGRR